MIVAALIHSLNRKHDTKVVGASAEFFELMQQRSWEGNVRELRNIVERAVILAGQGVICPTHVAHAESSSHDSALPSVAEAAPGAVAVRVGMTVEEGERSLLEATLVYAGNNKTRAASILGISKKTLHAKLRQYRTTDGEPVGEEVDA